MRAFLRAAAVCLLWVAAHPAQASPRPEDSVLYKIVHDCLDPNLPGYCSGACPQPLEGVCPQERSCGETTKLFAQSPDFAAIRDRKMCGCPAGFVHALAIPKSPVSGVEDPRRPNGVWPFAWNTALALFPKGDENAIALTVSPPYLRSQNQMHLHIVRLSGDARKRIAAMNPEAVADLKDAWPAAQRSASRSGIDGWYGVVAVRREDGSGFWVAAEKGSPEKDLSQYVCAP